VAGSPTKKKIIKKITTTRVTKREVGAKRDELMGEGDDILTSFRHQEEAMR